MGRTFAGVLGPLALSLVLLRGWLEGHDVVGTLWAAIGALFVFAGLGWLAGRVAADLVRQEARAQFLAEVDAQRSRRREARQSAVE